MAVEDYNALEGISAFVYLLLGVITLILSRRTKNNSWNEKYAAILFGWYLIFIGLRTFGGYLAGGSVDVSDWISDASEMTVWITTSARISIPIMIALIFPYPFLQNKNSIIISGIFTLIFTICLSGTYIFSDQYGFIIFRFVRNIPLLIWGFVFVRFSIRELLMEEEEARIISSSAGLLIFALGGVRIVDWLFWLVMPDRWIVAQDLRLTASIEDFNMGAYLLSRTMELSIAVSASMTIFIFESYRNYRKGSSLLSSISHIFLMIGIISFFVNLSVLDDIDKCVYDVCQGLPDSWIIYNTFTNNLAYFLVQPLIIMYVLLNYSLLDTKTDKNGTLARTMVILMVVIVSSTITEMIQAIVPIGDMITSGIMALGIAAAIGWEEKIMKRLLSFQESVNEYLEELNEIVIFEPDMKQIKQFSSIMFIIIIYDILMSIIHASLKLGF